MVIETPIVFILTLVCVLIGLVMGTLLMVPHYSNRSRWRSFSSHRRYED